MAFNSTATGEVVGVPGAGSNSTTEAAAADLTTLTGVDNDNRTASFISMGVLLGILLIISIVIYIVWRKCCKSIREKHGNEAMEEIEVVEQGKSTKKKRIYYDQFNVNDHQLTVNSVTAIKWDVDEERLSAKSSGIDCDSHSGSDKEVKQVQAGTGKKVFSVNKVEERRGKPGTTGNGSVVVRLPKEYRDAARSLQAGDTRQYTLALIDKNSKTIHNIDLARMRHGASPLVGLSGPHSARIRHHSNRRQHRRSEHAQRPRMHKRGMESDADVYKHDSPDMYRVRHHRGTMSADELDTKKKRHGSSSTDFSDTSSPENDKRSLSLSSADEGVNSSQPLISPTKGDDVDHPKQPNVADTSVAAVALSGSEVSNTEGEGETDKLLSH